MPTWTDTTARRTALVLTVVYLAAGCAGPIPAGTPTGSGTVISGEAPRFSAAELERALHREVNAARQRNRKPPLEWDAALAAVARSHSLDMAAHDFFDHTNREGETPSDRARRDGYACRHVEGGRLRTGIAENIFHTYRYGRYGTETRDGRTRRWYEWRDTDTLARHIVDGWLDSPGHRANLLHEAYTAEGLGVAVNAAHAVYITQNFC